MAGATESTACQKIIDVCEAIAETLWEESVESNFSESKEKFQGCVTTTGSFYSSFHIT